MRKPSKRQLMMKGSIWKALHDFEVVYTVKYNGVSHRVAKIKKDTEIKITGKIFSYGPYQSYFTDLFVSTSFDIGENEICYDPNFKSFCEIKPLAWKFNIPKEVGGKFEVDIPYPLLAKHAKLISEIPTQYFYVIRDTKTKKYVIAVNDFYPEFRVSTWLQEGYQSSRTNFPYFLGTLGQARKYRSLKDAKLSIKNITGYFNSFDPEDIQTKEYPFLNTFELVKFEKYSMIEKDTIDLQNWHRHIKALREITKKYSPEVRDLYYEIEKNNFKKWKYIVFFHEPIQEFSESFLTVQAISIKSKRTTNFVAIAAEDISTAFVLKSSTDVNSDILCVQELRDFVEETEKHTDFDIWELPYE